MEETKKFGVWKGLFTLNNSPFLVLILTFILLPLFFIPSPFVTFNFSKVILIAVGVILALMLFLINLLKNGNLSIPRHPVFLSLIGIVVVHLISTLFSGSQIMSLIGYGFETSTFTMVFLFVLFTFLVSSLFQSQKKLFLTYASFFVVSTLIAIFYLSRLLFGANFLSFGYLTDIASNTVGKWNELAIFFGVNAILSLMTLTMLKLKMSYRIGLIVSLLLSLIVLVIVNLVMVWYVIGVISLILFVYFLSFDSTKLSTVSVAQPGNEETRMKTMGRTVSFTSLILLIIALVFAFTPVGAYFAGKVNEKFAINNLDVRPSWSATYEIAQNTLKTDPILGAGPNRFTNEWQLYRPDVNLTNFWSLDFTSGIGWVPTLIIETGILGGIAWLVFFGSFLFFGFRAFFRKSGDRTSQYFTATSFIASLYLWILATIYVPSASILALTFFFTGLTIASIYMSGTHASKTFHVFKYRRLNFLVATVLVLIFVASAGFAYIFLEKAVAFSHFQRGVTLASTRETMDQSANYFIRAINLAPTDVYYRSIAELNLIRLNEIIAANANQQTISDEVKNEFQNVLASGIESSRRAQMWDKENYQNWVSVARVYEVVSPVGVEGAADGSRAAYGEALKLSPRNPGIYLAQARLEASVNNLPKAKENLVKALELKSNYLDAIFLLSQVDAAQGDIKASAVSVEKLFATFPNDPNVAFQLGILKYQIGDFPGAITALEKAVSNVPVYANARYFLGLSYEKVNRPLDAIAQFEEIEKTNPDNAEVKLILTNLRAGKPSLTSAEAPIDNKPEKRPQLPIEETTN